MTTQKVEEALEELTATGKRYHTASTFDNRLYWLKDLRNKAIALKDEIDETLNSG